MAPIKVPKTPPSAYDPDRKPNALILAHVRGLQSALRERGGTLKRISPDTEGAAAAYVRHLTRGLYDKTLLPDSKVALTMVGAAAGPAKRRPKKSKSKKAQDSAKMKATRRQARRRGYRP